MNNNEKELLNNLDFEKLNTFVRSVSFALMYFLDVKPSLEEAEENILMQTSLYGLNAFLKEDDE